MKQRKKQDWIQKKKRKRLRFSRHHFIPTSRGGTDDEYNCEYKPDKKHRALHQLFGNLKPSEIVERLAAWSKNGYELNEREVLSWSRIFGEKNCEEAIEVIRSEWTGPCGEIPAYLNDFVASKSDYPVRIDYLDFLSRIVTGEIRWSDGWVRASKKVTDVLMREIFNETKVPIRKISNSVPGGESILDIQLKVIQDLFSGKSLCRADIVIPVEIKYDRYYLFKLNQQIGSFDNIVRFLDFPHLFRQIIRRFVMAIISEEICAGDKIIFAIDENNQPGIWRQTRPKEKIIKKLTPA